MWDFIELVGLAFVPGFIVMDLLVGRRVFRTPRLWRLRGLIGTVVTLAVSIATAAFWATTLEGYSLLNLSGLGIIGGSVVGILVYELLHYTYHRAAHASDFLWRFHQMHHSPEALESVGALYQHPVDAALFVTLSSVVFVPLLGLPIETAIIGGVFITFCAMFQHANIATPRWLGYFIQRPESHGIHHGRGVHRNNYADLPLWDIVFGTFRNPKGFESEVGFYEGASSRVGAMLLGRDVSQPAVKSAATDPHHEQLHRPKTGEEDIDILFDPFVTGR